MYVRWSLSTPPKVALMTLVPGPTAAPRPVWSPMVTTAVMEELQVASVVTKRDVPSLYTANASN